MIVSPCPVLDSVAHFVIEGVVAVNIIVQLELGFEEMANPTEGVTVVTAVLQRRKLESTKANVDQTSRQTKQSCC